MTPETQSELQFYDLFHLKEAWFQVQRKKARGGIDGQTIEEFGKHADKHLQELSEALQADKYVPEPYERVFMKRPGSTTRPLGLPTVRDKIVQMAVRNAIEPIFNAMFLDCSYAYRPNKGHRKAIRRVEHNLGTGNVWVTTCDIDKFFDSLDHQILLCQVQEKIKDPRVIRLITLWLKIGIVHRDEYRESDKGVPQGGIISPLLSNIYLHPFDRHLVKRRYNLVRYADDFIILQKDKHTAAKAHDGARDFLQSELKLRLNPIKNKTWHVKSGFVFLGIQFRGYARTISDEKFKKARRKVEDICGKGRKKPLRAVVDELNESINSWRYYYGFGDTKKQFEELEATMALALSKLVKTKQAKGEFKSDEEAEKLLGSLKFLLNKKFEQQRRLVKAIAKGSNLKKIVGAKGEGKVGRALGKIRKEMKTGEQSPTARGKAKKLVGAVKRAITGKKKKYQRRKASMTDLVISRSFCRIGKMYKRIVVRKKGRILHQVPHMNLKHILIIADGVSLSSDVIRMCGSAGIPMDFIDIKGRPIARLSNPDFPTIEVGLAQLQAFHNGKAQILARTFVEAKVRNQLNLLKYFHKYHKTANRDFKRIFSDEKKRMEQYITELDGFGEEWSLEEKRGKLFALEGNAGSSYWSVIRELIKDEVVFDSRVRQGAEDLFNCLLNYGYGILYSRVWGAVLRAGLNPMISYLHTDQPRKPTLVFDIIEEYRPQAVDRVIVSMIGRGEELTMQGKLLSDETRRKVVQNVLERLNIPMKFRKRELSLSEIMTYQARSLADYLMGKKSQYWPFIGKW